MEESKKGDERLNLLRVDSLATAINRGHLVLHSTLISLLLYHRIHDHHQLILFLAELLLSLVWLFDQATRWRLIDRTTFVNRLPRDETLLPGLDVFVCTADPDKEPTVEVMNTVVSAMCLDYPAGKLNVYLSDDGGGAVTVAGIREAWGFATWWVPFCRRYGVHCRCPMAYFRDHNTTKSGGSGVDDDFLRDHALVKDKYKVFKERVETELFRKSNTRIDNQNSKNNHPPFVQVINENCVDASIINPDCSDLPLLVYVAREKRPSHPHHFKAGALNVLLRISGMLSNSPIVLVLDCDMYCNDPTSAKQAMCFFLDEDISPSLGYVQFPQMFHNLGKHEIYDMDFRWVMKGMFRGMDGLGTGPSLSGTCFYMNRKALYSSCVKGVDPVESRKSFGSSNKFIRTLSEDINRPNETKMGEISQEVVQETEFVASCLYERETKWGDGLGFYYYSVAEDLFTSYNLHIRGWKSIYLDPPRASFLGSSTTNLNDMLTQGTRWTAGMVEVGLSRFCPLTYGPSRRNMSLLPRACYAWIYLHSISCFSVWCFALIPPLCLLHGIPIYSKDTSSSFPTIGLFVFLSSQLKHFQEVLMTGGRIATWWNEQRTWTLKMLTGETYGSIDAVMSILGIKKTSFIPTNKVVDEVQEKIYRQGMYDFQTSNMFLVPLGTVVILNLVCFVVGSVRMMGAGISEEMAVQVGLSGFFVVMSKPVVEGMVVRTDRGRFPANATIRCVFVCLLLILLSHLALLYR